MKKTAGIIPLLLLGAYLFFAERLSNLNKLIILSSILIISIYILYNQHKNEKDKKRKLRTIYILLSFVVLTVAIGFFQYYQ